MNTNNGQLFTKQGNHRWAIRPLVPEDVYTDREEHLEYLYNAAINATGRRTMSTVHFVGQRRIYDHRGYLAEVYIAQILMEWTEQNPARQIFP